MGRGGTLCAIATLKVHILLSCYRNFILGSKTKGIHHPTYKESGRAISNARLLHSHFTPASYQRRSLQRPEKSNLVAGFVLRCFQHLSDPDLDTGNAPGAAQPAKPEVCPTRSSY